MAALLLLPSSGTGQELDRIRALSVDSLTAPVPTYFSPGLEAEAGTYAEIVARLNSVLFDSLGVSIEPVVAVLAPNDWSVFPTAPGMVPGVVGLDSGRYLVRVPVPTATMSAAYREAEPYLPAARLAELRAAGLSYSDAVASATEAILYHELGHIYALEMGIGIEPRWFAEFIASYIGYSGLVQVSEQDRIVWDAIMDARAAAPGPSPGTIAGFDGFLGSEGILWYQGHFAELVRELRPELGFDFVRDVQRIHTSRYDPDDLMARLGEISPRFITWADSLGR